MYFYRPEASGIGGHRIHYAVEYADHSPRSRTGFTQVETTGHGIRVVPQVYLYHGVFGVHLHMDRDLDPFRGGAGHRVVDAGGSGAATRHLFDSRNHEFFAVIEPLLLKGVEGIPAKFLCHGQNLAFPDAGRSHHGEIVPSPLFGNPDAHLAHTNDVRVILVILLYFDRGEDKGPFFINITCVPHIGRGLGVAAIGLMRLHPEGKVVDTLIVYHRYQDRVVGRVGAPMVGRVVQKGISPMEFRVQLYH